MASEFFGRQRECRFYTAGCGNKIAVTVTGPRAVNELGGPVIPGRGPGVQWLKLPAWKVGDRGFNPRSGVQVSLEYLCYWSTAIRHILILSVRGSSL